MRVEKFSIREAMQFGFRVASKNLAFFVLVLISILAIHFLVQFLLVSFAKILLFLCSGPPTSPEIALGILIIVIAAIFLGSIIPLIIHLLLYLFFDLGLIKICLRFCDNEKPKFSELFSQYSLLLRYIFASILYYSIFLFGWILYKLLSLFGLILFLIPGIILAIRLSLYDYFIVDKKSNIIEALKRSWQITKGNTINLFLFYLLCMLINTAGYLAFLIGLFWTIPITMVAKAFVYRKLLSFSENQKV